MVGEGDLFHLLRTTKPLQTPLPHPTLKEVLELPSRSQNYPIVMWKLPMATGHINWTTGSQAIDISPLVYGESV